MRDCVHRHVHRRRDVVAGATGDPEPPGLAEVAAYCYGCDGGTPARFAAPNEAAAMDARPAEEEDCKLARSPESDVSPNSRRLHGYVLHLTRQCLPGKLINAVFQFVVAGMYGTLPTWASMRAFDKSVAFNSIALINAYAQQHVSYPC